jgi:hypothetical protein
MVLQPNQRIKLDDSDDQLFYNYPRFVTHVDEGFIQQRIYIVSESQLRRGFLI